MFIYTLKASNIKFFAAVILSVAVLISLVAVMPDYGAPGDVAVVSYNYGNIKTNADRIKFIEQFGYKVLNDPIEDKEVIIPEEFDAVYEKYNDIQRAQGLNLKKFMGKKARKYSYLIENYPEKERVIFTLVIYKDKIIAGDICCANESGFISGFEKAKAPDKAEENPKN